MSVSVSDDQLRLLRCLKTGSHLVHASPRLIEQLNRGIELGEVRDQLGRPVEEPMEHGLTNAEVSVCYPIIRGTIQLLIDESIPLQQLEGKHG